MNELTLLHTYVYVHSYVAVYMCDVHVCKHVSLWVHVCLLCLFVMCIYAHMRTAVHMCDCVYRYLHVCVLVCVCV